MRSRLSTTFSAGLLVLAVCLAGQGQGVENRLSAEVDAGVQDYSVTIRVENRDPDNPLRGVRIETVDSPRYLTDLRVTPSRMAEIGPGASQEVRVRFGVNKQAPDGAEETVELRATSSEGILSPTDLRLSFAIRAQDREHDADADQGDDDRQGRPDRVYFVIKVEGTGFTPHWAGASHLMSGAHARVIGLERDQDPQKWLEAILAGYDHDICEIVNPRGFIRTNEPPQIWNAGPKITVLDGPFLSEWEAKKAADLNTWQSSSSKGPSLGKLKKAAGCG